MDTSTITVLWRDTLPPNVYIVAGGPAPRLRINRIWWRQASTPRRMEVLNGVARRGEAEHGSCVLTGGGPAQAVARLAWLQDVPLAWWLWLLDQPG